MAQNKQATRYFSSMQESRIARELGGKVIANSGAGRFDKADVVVDDISIECKTKTTDSKSITVQKMWFTKNKEEGFRNRLSHSVVAINFGPNDKDDKFIIDYKLMKYLVEKLKEDG